MAFEFDFNNFVKRDDDEGQPLAAPASTVASTGGGAAPTGGQASAKPAQQAGPAPASSNFVSFDRTMNANRPAAGRTAHGLAMDVRGLANKAEAPARQLTQDFKTDIHNRAGSNSTTQWDSRPTSLFGFNPTQYTQIQADAAKAQKAAQALGSTAGIQASLQQKNKSPNNTPARSLFDATLARQSDYGGFMADQNKRYGDFTDQLLGQSNKEADAWLGTYKNHKPEINPAAALSNDHQRNPITHQSPELLTEYQDHLSRELSRLQLLDSGSDDAIDTDARTRIAEIKAQLAAADYGSAQAWKRRTQGLLRGEF